MLTWDKQLWRIAVEVEAAYRRGRKQEELEAFPVETWNQVLSSQRRRQLAEERGWYRAAEDVRQDVSYELDDLIRRFHMLKASLNAPRAPRLPVASELYAELLAAQHEFGGLKYEDFELSVTTEEIELDGIYLGPFEICLQLPKLGKTDPYRVTAVDPHPASSCCDTTHPHVNGERLCAGDGLLALRAALEEGRLGDFFVIVDRILHTYAVGSAYVELSSWYGISCKDCGDLVDDDEAYSCDACDQSLCGGCVRACCHCDRSRCDACICHCARCDERCCEHCLKECAGCGDETCTSCLEEGLCHECREDPDEEGTDAAESPQPEPAIHPVLVGQVVIPPRPRHHRNRRLRGFGRHRPVID